MSQRLSDLIKPYIKDEDASHFLEKALSPSAPISAQQVPDSNSLPTHVIHSQTTQVIGPPANQDPTKPWSFAVLLAPTAGIPAYVRKVGKASNGTAIIENSIIGEGSPLLDTALKSASSGTRYRITAKSATIDQDASATTNKGTVYGADVRNSYCRGNTGLTGGTDPSYATYYWRGQNMAAVATPSVLSTMPGAVSWKASQGMYMVSRNTGSFEWARADLAYVQDPTLAGTFGGVNAASAWEPCLDWSVPVCIFDNLDVSSAYPTKIITCYEIIPEISSILQDGATLSATNPTAISVYKSVSDRFGQFYPADFNDWGTLWNSVKSLFATAKPFLSGAARFVPGIGPVLSTVIDSIPVSKEKQLEEQRRKTEAANRNGTTEAAQTRVAQRILSDNKSPQPALVKVKQISYKTKKRTPKPKLTRRMKRT